MTTEMTTRDANGLAKVEQVLIAGDLSKLTAEERLTYYRAVCESVGLNPLTKPFDYLTLSGRLVLYAKRDATDQLRKIHGVSITDLDERTVEDVYVVTAKARDKEGRTDASKGAVNVAGLRGEAKANAMMKAETKAKRRVTLSLCGLGMLDETEVETIPGAVPLTSTPTVVTTATAEEALAPDRDVLLGRIKGAADRRGMKAPARAALWSRYCANAAPDTVDVSALSDLLAAIESGEAA